MKFFVGYKTCCMNEMNKPKQRDDNNALQSSELYNRPGSTEHNDYRILGKNEGLTVGGGKDNDEDKNKTQEQQQTDDND